MAVYDSSVILRCLHGDNVACRVIFSDKRCTIPPTTYEEIKPDWNVEGRKEIERHCRIYKKTDPPFNDLKTTIHVEEFVSYIDRNYLRAKPSGKKARLIRWFQKNCHGSGNLEHRLNDYRIFKQANILKERGVDGADVLVSADHAHTLRGCQEIYRRIMEEELPKEIREKLRIKVKPL